MENEEEIIEEEVIEEEETNNEETPEETKEVKPQESLEDKRSRLARQLEQVNKKLGIEPNKEVKKSSKKDELGYGEKAFLIANGIKGEAETDFFKAELRKSGETMDSLVDNEYFKAKLSDFRDKAKTVDATPTGSKRTNQSSSSQVEYWLAKGEMPPANNPELRQAYVNAKLKKEGAKGVFYNS